MKEPKRKKDPLEVKGRAKGYSCEELVKNLKRHSSFSPILIQQIKKTPNEVLRNFGTPFAKKVNKMMREVFTEAYRAKQFTRTKINNRGVLYGIVLLKHKVMDLVLKYFHERWPECVVCLYNEHNLKTGIINENGSIFEMNKSLKETIEYISKDREIFPYFNDIQFSGEEIFETLYNSQNIPERENCRYFRSMIPRACFELPGMRGGVEKQFKNKKINDYF